MVRNRPSRLASFDYRGFHRYHVRTSTWRGDPLLASDTIACVVRSQLFHSADRTDVEVDAYSLMPDHAHVLVHCRSATSVATDFMRDWKQRSAYAVRQRHRVRLWRPGYFDRVLREHEGTVLVAKYILENPVREGLAREIGHHPWTWCRWEREVREWGDW